MEIAKQIKKTRDIIRQKARALKMNESDFSTSVVKTLQPVLTPLKEIAINTKLKEITSPLKERNQEIVSPLRLPARQLPVASTPKASHSLSQSLPQSRARLFDESISTPAQELPTVYESPAEAVPQDMSIAEFAEKSGQLNVLESALEKLGPISRKYVNYLFVDKGPKSSIDLAYGPWYDVNTLKLGNKNLDFDENDYIFLDGKRFNKATEGLLELIFMKRPNKNLFTKNDLKIYKQILEQTNAHRQYHTPFGQIKSNAGKKYMEIIRDFFTKKTVGSGILKRNRLRMKLDDKKTNFVYYDDYNELIDRLRILEAEKVAGNNGNSNEMNNIIQELEEANIIKKPRKNFKF